LFGSDFALRSLADSDLDCFFGDEAVKCGWLGSLLAAASRLVPFGAARFVAVELGQRLLNGVGAGGLGRLLAALPGCPHQDLSLTSGQSPGQQ
jgi:hypothetical protein